MIVVESNIEDEVLPELRKFDVDMRKARRAVVKEAADEFRGLLRVQLSSHEVTGDTKDSVRKVPVNGGWGYDVKGSSVIRFLNDGTAPHPVDPSVLEQAASQYGMDPGQLANHIMSFGTKPYRVIENAEDRMPEERIVERVLRQRGLI